MGAKVQALQITGGGIQRVEVRQKELMEKVQRGVKNVQRRRRRKREGSGEAWLIGEGDDGDRGGQIGR